jgi:hypothetical protein
MTKLKTARLRALERSTIAALNSAMAAREKLATATEAAGDVFIKPFLTLDEHARIVRRMYRDHQAELAERDRSMIVGMLIAGGATEHPDYPEVAECRARAQVWGAYVHAMHNKFVDIETARKRKEKTK